MDGLRGDDSMESSERQTNEQGPRWPVYLLLWALSALLPILLWRWQPAWIGYTRDENQLYELFAFFATLSTLGIAAWELKRRRVEGWRGKLKILVPAAVALHFLFIFSEYSFKSWDYRRYEIAAQAVKEGGDPYGQGYLYPPLLAQGMAMEAGWLESFSDSLDEKQIWDLVFYLHQCLQFLMLNLAFALGYRLARSLGVEDWIALALMAALLLFNAQVYRSLRYNQINLMVLNAFLLGIVLSAWYPLAGGLAAAVGGHLKLYPALMLFPWLATRRWKALLGFVLGAGAILWLQTDQGRDFGLWSHYFEFASTSDLSTTQFRDNSLDSLAGNLMSLGGLVANPQGLAHGLAIFLKLAVVGWFGMRAWQRRWPTSDLWQEFCGHSADAIAMSLLLSPLVWAYHYVIAIPIVIFAWAARGTDAPWKVGIVSALMLSLPVFDVFPFSYHRMVTLVILLILTSPKKIPPAFWREGSLESTV